MSDSTTVILIEFIDRELNSLISEIDSYSDESNLWVVEHGIGNSSGTLALHIAGNLNHFIGSVLGKSGYVRHRESEFSDRNVPRQQIVGILQHLRTHISDVIFKIDESALEMPYPLEKHGQIVTHRHMLLHLLCHLNYHLGQVNYHRRLIDLK